MSELCRQGKCNIWALDKLRGSMIAGAPGRADLEPPEVPEVSYVVALGPVAAGVLASAQGGTLIALGVLLVIAGVVVALGLKNSVDEAKAARAEWEASRWCVACDKRLPPGWRPPTEAA